MISRRSLAIREALAARPLLGIPLVSGSPGVIGVDWRGGHCVTVLSLLLGRLGIPAPGPCWVSRSCPGRGSAGWSSRRRIASPPPGPAPAQHVTAITPRAAGAAQRAGA